MVKNYFENQNCAIFEEVVDNFSDNDLIDTYNKENWFSCPACTNNLERYLLYIQGQVINICGCQRLMTQLPFLMFSNFSFGDMYTNLKDICCDASKIPICEAKNLIYRARGTVGSQKGKYHPPPRNQDALEKEKSEILFVRFWQFLKSPPSQTDVWK